MELENITKVYLVGIGGIGMSGLARYFHKRGCLVKGYDRTVTPLTRELESEGIEITYTDRRESIAPGFLKNNPSLLVIYTPAIPADSSILSYFRNNGFNLNKRSQVLGIISRGMFTVAVAGTHGKTTTSTLIAHILRTGGNECTAFLGGISANYNSNVLFGGNNVIVVEADEYDRSFLALYPDIAVITSMDADHLDIYGTVENVRESFGLFASQIKENGKLIVKKGLMPGSGISYSASEPADACAFGVRVENGSFVFSFRSGDVEIKDIIMPLPGLHNIENAVAAIRVALFMDINPERIKSAIESFRGVKRRFEYIVKSEATIYIDDYAHHPEELRACLSAARQLYPDRKLTVVFQPHLYTRTRDFADDFAKVLSEADELVLLDIYPARELPIPGITSELILEKAGANFKKQCSMDEVLRFIKGNKPELLITAGAGDIDTLVEPIKNLLCHA